jgi:hypothetical protein
MASQSHRICNEYILHEWQGCSELRSFSLHYKNNLVIMTTYFLQQPKEKQIIPNTQPHYIAGINLLLSNHSTTETSEIIPCSGSQIFIAQKLFRMKVTALTEIHTFAVRTWATRSS